MQGCFHTWGFSGPKAVWPKSWAKLSVKTIVEVRCSFSERSSQVHNKCESQPFSDWSLPSFYLRGVNECKEHSTKHPSGESLHCYGHKTVTQKMCLIWRCCLMHKVHYDRTYHAKSTYNQSSVNIVKSLFCYQSSTLVADVTYRCRTDAIQFWISVSQFQRILRRHHSPSQMSEETSQGLYSSGPSVKLPLHQFT